MIISQAPAVVAGAAAGAVALKLARDKPLTLPRIESVSATRQEPARAGGDAREQVERLLKEQPQQ